MSTAPSVPEPSLAERARTLVHLGRMGTLSTLSAKHPGWPFGSLMPYAGDEHGRPVFLISSMAMHTHNLLTDARAGLLISQIAPGDDPLASSRVTLMGEVRRLEGEESAKVRGLYLARYENARYWVDFEDFAFYRMELADVYLVAGFGVMGWVSASQYESAEADPLADAAPGIIQHMNADHADALVELARTFAGQEADAATMTSIDRLGFNVRMKSGDRVHGARIAFPREIRSTMEARTVLVEMVKAARGQAAS